LVPGALVAELPQMELMDQIQYFQPLLLLAAAAVGMAGVLVVALLLALLVDLVVVVGLQMEQQALVDLAHQDKEMLAVMAQLIIGMSAAAEAVLVRLVVLVQQLQQALA
jgi:hypothetical protein